MTDRVTLADGRTVGIAEHGDPSGTPVFVLHGTPASRLGHEFTDAPARQRAVRIICPDRPGIGLSDPKPGRTVASYAADLAAVADVLGIDRFAVIGYSCGGPYAVAVAAGAPDRVTAAATMAGVGPLDRPGARDGLSKSDLQLLDLSQRRPWLAGIVLRAMKVGARLAPSVAAGTFKKDLSEVDQRALDEDDPKAVMAFFVESMRHGPRGVIDEYRVWGAPWGVDFGAITAPVHVFQGDDDRMVPMTHAEDYVRRIPTATLHRLAGEGHVSIQRHIGEILDAVRSDPGT